MERIEPMTRPYNEDPNGAISDAVTELQRAVAVLNNNLIEMFELITNSTPIAIRSER